MDSYLSQKILIKDDEIELGDKQYTSRHRGMNLSKYSDKDDSYRLEGGSDDDEESDEEMNADEFDQQLKDEKSRLFWNSIKDFFIGFLIAAAMFGIFYGVVSIEPVDDGITA